MSNHLNDEQIQSYLDNQDRFDKTYIQEHLKTCTFCQENLKEYRNLYTALNTDSFPALPKDFSTQIVSAISNPQESRWQFFESGFIIAFFLFGISASLYFVNPLPFIANVVSNIIGNLGEYATKFIPELNGGLPIFIVAIVIFLLVEIIDKKILRPRL